MGLAATLYFFPRKRKGLTPNYLLPFSAGHSYIIIFSSNYCRFKKHFSELEDGEPFNYGNFRTHCTSPLRYLWGDVTLLIVWVSNPGEVRILSLSLSSWVFTAHWTTMEFGFDVCGFLSLWDHKDRRTSIFSWTTMQIGVFGYHIYSINVSNRFLPGRALTMAWRVLMTLLILMPPKWAH